MIKWIILNKSLHVATLHQGEFERLSPKEEKNTQQTSKFILYSNSTLIFVYACNKINHKNIEGEKVPISIIKLRSQKFYWGEFLRYWTKSYVSFITISLNSFAYSDFVFMIIEEYRDIVGTILNRKWLHQRKWLQLEFFSSSTVFTLLTGERNSSCDLPLNHHFFGSKFNWWT